VNHFTGDFGTRIAYWFGRDVGSFVLQDGCHVRDTKLNGKVAAFTLGDVLCPDPGDVLDAVGTDLTVRGRIVYLSDRGSSRDQFAIVDVAGVHAPLVVPVSRLTFEAETPADQPRPAALMPEGSQLEASGSDDTGRPNGRRADAGESSRNRSANGRLTESSAMQD
jgi:hypothetical protein